MAEILIAAFLLLLLLVPLANLAGSLGGTSSGYRQSVVAQNVASAEMEQLQAETSGSNGFPPPDAPQASTGLAGADLNVNNYVTKVTNGGEEYKIYIVGGWCALDPTTSPYQWEPYPTVPTSSKTPPAFWVAVVVTWNSKGNSNYDVTTTGTDPGPYYVSPSPHLVLTGIIPTPLGDQHLDSGTLPSICPAEIR